VLADILFMSAFDRGCLITATPAHTSPSRPCANTAGKGKTEDTHNSPDFFFSLLFPTKELAHPTKIGFPDRDYGKNVGVLAFLAFRHRPDLTKSPSQSFILSVAPSE
jgi:hypothetical protein